MSCVRSWGRVRTFHLLSRILLDARFVFASECSSQKSREYKQPRDASRLRGARLFVDVLARDDGDRISGGTRRDVTLGIRRLTDKEQWAAASRPWTGRGGTGRCTNAVL